MSADKQALKKQMKEREDLTKKRDDKCIPVAEKVFDIISEVRPTFDMQNKEQAHKEYENVVTKILTAMRSADLDMDEGQYVMRLCAARVDLISITVEKSVEISKMDMQEKVFGKPVGKLTFDEVDNYLKKGTMSDENVPAEEVEAPVEETVEEAPVEETPSEE